MFRSHILLAAAFLFGFVSTQAQDPEPAPIQMPADRAADSYRIYSSLIPLGETGGPTWPHELWLVESTTITAVPFNQSCSSSLQGANEPGMNPHSNVKPPEDRRQDYNEILEDFDRHCHDRITLDPHAFHLSVPLRLLDKTEENEFMSTRATHPADPAIAAKYKGAPALFRFSEVYFNHSHTVALVYATSWCGGLCGQGFWIPEALQNGQWIPLQGWNSTSWIS